MHARVSTFRGTQDLELATKQVREEILPQAKALAGFKGMIAMGDRESGETIGITLWESEEAMRASEEAANRLRQTSTGQVGEEIVGVKRYEVALIELES